MSTALVVDDERQMTMIVEYALANQGFTVHTAHDGATALNLLRTHEVDLVVLDVRMPTIDGLDLCERIRAGSDVPIMLLTALAQPEDVIAGLERGADDYVTKPFHPKELVLRAQALVRRYRGGGDGRVLRNGELVIDPVRREVTVAGRRLTLSYTEFRLLYCLTARRGEALSWRRLLREVWGTDNLIGGRELVKATVYRLRGRLRMAGLDADYYVQTVRNVGYMVPDLWSPADDPEPDRSPDAGPDAGSGLPQAADAADGDDPGEA